MDVEDLYELLGVSPQAPPEVVRAAYRRLARTYHPDGVTPDAEKMVSLNLAFEVLGDPIRRAAYDRERASGGLVAPVEHGAATDTQGGRSRPGSLSDLPPIEYFDDPPAVRDRVVLWGVGALVVAVLAGSLMVGASLLRGGDEGPSAAAPVEGAGSAAPPLTLEVPPAAPPTGTAVAATAAPVSAVARDLGPIASDLPGTALPLGSAVRAVVDQNTKPRDVFAVSLAAGQEIRFVLTDLASPISAWLEVSLLNPGARDLGDPRSFTQALARTAYRGDEWRFTPAVAGTYYLVVRSRTSGQAYAFTLAATR